MSGVFKLQFMVLGLQRGQGQVSFSLLWTHLPKGGGHLSEIFSESLVQLFMLFDNKEDKEN